VGVIRQFCKHVRWLMSTFWDFVDKRHLVRRSLVLWWVWLSTTSVLASLAVLETINASGASVVVGVLGLNAFLLHLYQNQRQEDDRKS